MHGRAIVANQVDVPPVQLTLQVQCYPRANKSYRRAAGLDPRVVWPQACAWGRNWGALKLPEHRSLVSRTMACDILWVVLLPEHGELNYQVWLF